MSSTPNSAAENSFHQLADCMMQNGKVNLISISDGEV